MFGAWECLGERLCRSTSFEKQWLRSSILRLKPYPTAKTTLPLPASCPKCLQGGWWRVLILTFVFWSVHTLENSHAFKNPNNAVFFENNWVLVWNGGIKSLLLTEVFVYLCKVLIAQQNKEAFQILYWQLCVKWWPVRVVSAMLHGREFIWPSSSHRRYTKLVFRVFFFLKDNLWCHWETKVGRSSMGPRGREHSSLMVGCLLWSQPLVKESFFCLGLGTSFVTELAVVGDSLLLEVITHPQGHGDSDLILLICKMGIRDGASFSYVFAPLD